MSDIFKESPNKSIPDHIKNVQELLKLKDEGKIIIHSNSQNTKRLLRSRNFDVALDATDYSYPMILRKIKGGEHDR